MRNALRLLFCVFSFVLPLHGQADQTPTLTIEGHLAPFKAKLTSCDCVPGTQGIVTLQLSHYFTTVIGTIYRREAIYPIGIAPPGHGVDPLEFISNEATITIGKDIWRSHYPNPRPAQSLNLVAWDKRYGEFQSLDGKVFMFRDLPEQPDGRPRIALLNLDLRTSNDLSLWNVTGAAIPSGKPTGFSQFGLLFFGNQERVVFTVDNVSASPVEVAETTIIPRAAPPSSPAEGNKNGYYSPNPPPVLPGGGTAPPAAGSGARVPASCVPLGCYVSLASTTRLMDELLILERVNPLFAFPEMERAEFLITAQVIHSAATCIAEAYNNASAMSGNGGGGPPINWGKQRKHTVDENNKTIGTRSILTADPEELAKSAGTGTPANNVPRGQAGFKERIDFKKIIGIYVDDQGNGTPSTNAMFVYDKAGSIHIYPARP